MWALKTTHTYLSDYERDDHGHEELREDGGERDRRRGAQLSTHKQYSEQNDTQYITEKSLNTTYLHNMLRNEQNSCFYSQTPAAEEEWPQSPVDSTEKWLSHYTFISLFFCLSICLLYLSVVSDLPENSQMQNWKWLQPVKKTIHIIYIKNITYTLKKCIYYVHEILWLSGCKVMICRIKCDYISDCNSFAVVYL